MYTHPFNGPLFGTIRVSRYHKGKTNLDFTGARDSEWQWHQLGHMQVCASLQTDNHATTPPLSFYRLDAFLPPNQQHQSTEGTSVKALKALFISYILKKIITVWVEPCTSGLSMMRPAFAVEYSCS